MKSNVNKFKKGLFILVILAFSLNAFPQTVTIYQSNFDAFADSTILGTTLSAANDNWRVNSNAVQKTEASQQSCMNQLRPKDEFRNAWFVTDSWHWQPFSPTATSTTSKEMEPIDGAGHKDLGVCAFWGKNGTTTYEFDTCTIYMYGIPVGSGSVTMYGVRQYFSDIASAITGTSARYAYRVMPSTNGYTSITLQFKWRCGGKASYEQDYGQVGYSTNGGTSWTWLATHYQGATTVNQNANISLPAACENQNNLAIGFGFVCAGKGSDQNLADGGYPSFVIDDVVLQGTKFTCNGVQITAQPVSVPLCIPGSTSFSITADGQAPISYQWQASPSWKNLTNSGIYSGATAATLKVTNPTTTLQYRCIASNCSPVVYVTSDAATLTVQTPVKVDPSFFNDYQCPGKGVTFALATTGGTGPFSYQWLQNGKPVTDGTGGTSSVFSNSSISQSDTGTYTCIISNACNNVTGKVVHLTVPRCDRTHHAISGNVTYDNTPKTLMTSQTAETTTNIYLYNSLGDTLIQSTQTDNFGNYEFINLVNGVYWIFGNSVKPWGGGNPIDGLLINKVYIHTGVIKDSLWYAAALVSGDKAPSPIDALEINRRYINLIGQFTGAPDWRFEKLKVTVASVDLVENLEAECYGDINGSFVPPLLKPRLIYTQVNSTGTLNINSGQQFEIPVFINANTDLGALGIKFKAQSSKFKVLGVKSDIDGLIYKITDDGINIAWSATDNAINVTPDKPVLMLQAIYTGIQNPEALLLSPESVIADINVNVISNDNIIMPRIVISSQQQQPSASLVCYPNPFSNITNIAYTIPEDLNVKIDIYNVLGEQVATLANCFQKAGKYNAKFDGTNLRRGVYYCKIEATNSTSTFTKTDIMIIAR